MRLTYSKEDEIAEVDAKLSSSTVYTGGLQDLGPGIYLPLPFRGGTIVESVL